MINKQSIAVQLYSAREELADDFAGTMRSIASYGYRAVEVATLPADVSVDAAKSLFDDLGIKVVAAHSPLPLGVNREGILDHIKSLDCEYLVCPWMTPEEYFSDLDGIKAACEMLNRANEVVKSADLKLVYHNHWFEMEVVEGKPAYQHMLNYLDADILFELDTYWAKVAGLNPVDVIDDFKHRLPLLHIKDGTAANNTDDMVALGDGVMDIPAILDASPADWHIVEIDHCATDMMTVIKDSYSYLMELNA